jgi:hypothetical protein
MDSIMSQHGYLHFPRFTALEDLSAHCPNLQSLRLCGKTDERGIDPVPVIDDTKLTAFLNSATQVNP